MLHGEYNTLLNEETLLGYGDDDKKIGNLKKGQINDLDNLFNIYDDEGESNVFIIFYFFLFRFRTFDF